MSARPGTAETDMSRANAIDLSLARATLAKTGHQAAKAAHSGQPTSVMALDGDGTSPPPAASRPHGGEVGQPSGRGSRAARADRAARRAGSGAIPLMREPRASERAGAGVGAGRSRSGRQEHAQPVPGRVAPTGATVTRLRPALPGPTPSEAAPAGSAAGLPGSVAAPAAVALSAAPREQGALHGATAPHELTVSPQERATPSERVAPPGDEGRPAGAAPPSRFALLAARLADLDRCLGQMERLISRLEADVARGRVAYSALAAQRERAVRAGAVRAGNAEAGDDGPPGRPGAAAEPGGLPRGWLR